MLAEGSASFTMAAVWRRSDAQGGQVICEQADEGAGRRASLLTVNDRYGFNGQNNDQHDLLRYRPGLFAISVMTLEDSPGDNVQ